MDGERPCVYGLENLILWYAFYWSEDSMQALWKPLFLFWQEFITNPKVHTEMHATQSGQSYLEKNKVEDSYFPISKLKIKLWNQAVWYWPKYAYTCR